MNSSGMRGTVTTGIVLARTNFQEADRIITVLTPDYGKIRLMAKGVRRVKSKLAGGIELFSVSDVTFLPGRKEIGTLISSRLVTHYGDIVQDINRTMLGYELLKRINRVTEDAAGEEYFKLLNHVLAGLNNKDLPAELIELWFTMQLLKITGHSPKLRTDTIGNSLAADKNYKFSYDDMCFLVHKDGPFRANHIKLLRLGIGTAEPGKLSQVKGTENLASETLLLANTMLTRLVRV